MSGQRKKQTRSFPSMRAAKLLRILKRKPLEYSVTRRKGSHRQLTSPNGYPDLLFSFHDTVELGPAIVRKVLVNDVGLTDDEAAELL